MQTELRGTLTRLGLDGDPAGVAIGAAWRAGGGRNWTVRSPIDGSTLATFTLASRGDVEDAVAGAAAAFHDWRSVPAPQRGELVRRFGERLRAHKADLATLVSWEAGKIRQEALGEVQEMIDVCDFAVGLSRQLYGLTIASERPLHRLTEQWHPLGPIGVITAFNFPVAVWAWNAAIALVCGDSVVWKPSEKTPLCALACHALLQRVIAELDDGTPAGLSSVVVGGAEVGQTLAASRSLLLISATGSVRMGRAVATTVAERLGRSLLELGGNNGAIVTPSADLELAIRGVVFAAVGTCGQRCTSLRRLIVHESLAEDVLNRLLDVYAQLSIGHPLDDGVLVGPLVDAPALEAMNAALERVRGAGGKIHGGGRVTDGVPRGGIYVHPAIVEISADAEILLEET
ncbi:MAG TPA: aldehyde dehydrogenase family protein, partial [Gammaproteobacteria bacterium]|nr:aldehyde dehydrogenase family protein [Gammaproteobacteria bacterium]